MGTESFDWALVKSFVAVLDTGSFMGAARKIGAQQPTLSRHIAELEAQLGTSLFERTGRGVVPTAAALAIETAAREMDLGAAALSRVLARQSETTTGVVRISASQEVSSYLLPSVLAALQIAEPGIQIELVVSNAISNLLRREADIAVRMVRPTQGSLVAKKIGDAHIFACAHKRYLKIAGTPVHAQELLAHKIIGYDRDDTIVRGFARMGIEITRDKFAICTDDHFAYGQLIAAGMGIGFASGYHLRNLDGVVAILPTLQVPPLPCWLVVHREIRGSVIVRRVYDFLAAALIEEFKA
jgi:DNA-binding transcriptional LysR family regulator